MTNNMSVLWLISAVVALVAGLGLIVYLGRGTEAQSPAPTLQPATQPATATPTALPPTAAGPFMYSAKFLCGFQDAGALRVDPGDEDDNDGDLISNLPAEPPVKPGNYATALNIHNPQNDAVDLERKAVLSGFTPREAGALEEAFPPGQLTTFRLEPNWAFEIDCPGIAVLLGDTLPAEATFIKGFVVLESLRQLDVVAVYTAERKDEHKNVECLLSNNRVVEATLQADGTRRCPSGTKNIGVGQGTGTGMTMDVEYLTPRVISAVPPPATPPPSPPSDAPTLPPTPSPAPVQCPGPTCWGDIDCDAEIGQGDADYIRLFVIALPLPPQVEPCPDIGTEVQVGSQLLRWGDVDCDGAVSSRDFVSIEQWLAGTPLSQTEPCPDIGLVVQLGP